MKKALIITYYWPPAGGIAVQRWLQLSKYFKDNLWEPIIFTVRNPNYPIFDHKLNQQVNNDIKIIKVNAPEPNNLISFFEKKSKQSDILYKLQQQSKVETSFWKKLLWSIRGNLFIPDSRMFWIKKSYKNLNKYLLNNKIDVIISTGPPHSAHMIAYRLNKKHKIPWVSDFRDPWTSMDYLKKMNLRKFAKQKHAKMEKLVLENSSQVIVVGKTIQKEFLEKYNIESEIIYNGYNPADQINDHILLDKKFSIVHTGSFLHYRNCDDLWQTLGELVNLDNSFSENLEIKLVGNIAPSVLNSIELFNLNNHVSITSHVDHLQAKIIQRSAQLLLLPIDRIENPEFVITGKIFEYLQAKRPILLIGPPKGDAAEIVKSCSAGLIADFNDTETLKKIILEKYSLFIDGKNHCNSVGFDKFSYPHLTKEVIKLLEKVIND